MLGLGASHLSLLSPGDHGKSALKHRVTAIQALNEHLSKPNLSHVDSDAAFGAMLALTFQAAYMADGLVDFFTMVRGCTRLSLSVERGEADCRLGFLIGNNLITDMDNSIFKHLARAAYVNKVRDIVRHSTSDHFLDSIIAEEFCRSIKQLGPLCKSVPELQYLAHMQKIAQLAATNPTESKLAMWCLDSADVYKASASSPSSTMASANSPLKISRPLLTQTTKYRS